MSALDTTRSLLGQDAKAIDPFALPFAPYLSLSAHARATLQPLPFWEEAMLVGLEDPALAEQCPMWFVLRENRVVFLDGTSEPIHAVNGQVPLQWSPESVMLYLKFFNFFIRIPEGGPFLILDSSAVLAGQHIGRRTRERLCAHLRPPVVALADDICKIETCLLYWGDLYLAHYTVQRTGKIFMHDDDLLCRVGFFPAAPMLKSLSPLLPERPFAASTVADSGATIH